MNSIKAYESFFICQQLLVTAVVVAGFIFGVIYLIHRIGLENRAVDEANKENEKVNEKEEKQTTKEPIKNDEKIAEINKKKATYRDEILARFEKPVEKDNGDSKETKVPNEKDGKQMVEEAVETASVFGDTTVAIDSEEHKEKPANVVTKPQPKTKTADKNTSTKGANGDKPKNVVKKPKPKAEAPKVDIMGEL